MSDNEKNMSKETVSSMKPVGQRGRKKSKVEFNSRYLTISVYVVMTFTACLIVYKILGNLKDFKNMIGTIMSAMSPFLIAFLIAYFLTPIVKYIDNILFTRFHLDKKLPLHKVLSLLIAYAIFIGGIVLMMTFVVPQIIESIIKLVRQSSNYYQTISQFVTTLDKRFPDIDFNVVQEIIDQTLPNAIQRLQNFMTDMIPVIYSASVSIINWIINIIMEFVISCYLLSDKQNLLAGLKKISYALFDVDTAYKLQVTCGECNKIFSSFIIGKSIDSLIIGILCFLCMSVLKLPYEILISVIVGVTNMIPYFGPFIGAVPGVIILLLISPKSALMFLVLILVLQQLDGTVIGPRILGNSTGLQPIWIIFAITGGGAIGGVIGMFLGVPIVGIMVYLFNNWVDYCLYKRDLQPDLSNVVVPEVNEDNVLIPKDFIKDPKIKQEKKKEMPDPAAAIGKLKDLSEQIKRK